VQRIGSPDSVNQNLIKAIQKIRIIRNPLQTTIINVLFSELSSSHSLLDIGQSLRLHSNTAMSICKSYKTLDLNQFEQYPDYLVDICDPIVLEAIQERYDFITCFSLLEHTYQPFLACQNLVRLLNKGGKIYGSAPFLYPRHSPTDLSYQDYFRFTRDAYAILFPNVASIELYPLRGRIGTSLMVLTSRYRTIAEARFPRLTRWINSKFMQGDHLLQSSGYEFVVTV
jgi:hypothetical protein